MPASYYIHIDLQCKVGDHTSLQSIQTELELTDNETITMITMSLIRDGQKSHQKVIEKI